MSNQASEPVSLIPPWRIGVDVGGTFTDMVLSDASGAMHVFKVPSVPADPGEGVVAALGQAADRFALPLPDLLRDCALFVHGSTVATNTMLERRGATVGLLTTEGFRDSLEIRRGIREDQWDHRAPFPEVLVPRYLRLPVGGRIDRDGTEYEAFDAGGVAEAMKTFEAEGVESVAICLINSFLNPAHESAAKSAVEANWDGEWISASNDIAPVMGEYERGSTTVVNAYLAPKVVAYLQALDRQLRQLGLTRSILLVQSNGGAVSVDQVAARPVNLVLSGPAAGVGALNLVRRAAGTEDLISMEIGGTSCDVALMSGGKVGVTDQLIIDGYHLATPAVEIHTVGAGGGTIARVDDAGMLHVGPQGAGARPGPAAYGFGGQDATVTDAQLLLGRLRSGPYAGGAVTLDGGAAREAITRTVAEPLSIAAEAAAAGIVQLLEQNLLHAVERISLQRGYNPRGFTLVAAGGAGPMHGASVGRALGCPRVYVPRQAGAFCAVGMLHSDVRQDYGQVFLGDLDRADRDDLKQGYDRLEGHARASLDAEGFGADDSRIEREIDLRYRSQQYSIRVPLTNGFDPAGIRKAFEAEHDRQFGHIQPDGAIEITSLHVVGRGLFAEVTAGRRERADGAPTPVETRTVYQNAADGWADTPVYAGADLEPGHQLDGPLLVEEQTTTVFVGVGDRLEVDAADNFLIHLSNGSAT